MEERGEALNSIYKPFPPRLKSYITFFFKPNTTRMTEQSFTNLRETLLVEKKIEKKKTAPTYTACPHHFGESNIDYVVYSERLVHARICDIFI